MIKMNLRYLLDKNKLTQKQLAESTNIPKNTVNRYFNGTWTTINKEHLDALCRYFNCDINDLIEYKQDTYIAPNQLRVDLDNPPDVIEINSNKLLGNPDPVHQFGYRNTGTFIELSKEEIDSLTEKDLEDIHAYLRVKNMLNLIKHHNDKDN